MGCKMSEYPEEFQALRKNDCPPMHEFQTQAMVNGVSLREFVTGLQVEGRANCPPVDLEPKNEFAKVLILADNGGTMTQCCCGEKDGCSGRCKKEDNRGEALTWTKHVRLDGGGAVTFVFAKEYNDSPVIYFGCSFCSPHDQFSRKQGRFNALVRINAALNNVSVKEAGVVFVANHTDRALFRYELMAKVWSAVWVTNMAPGWLKDDIVPFLHRELLNYADQHPRLDII